MTGVGGDPFTDVDEDEPDVSPRRFHYRPWMGFGLWFLGIPVACWTHEATWAAGSFVFGLLASRLWPWGPAVFECWDGCGHGRRTYRPRRRGTGGERP